MPDKEILEAFVNGSDIEYEMGTLHWPGLQKRERKAREQNNIPDEVSFTLCLSQNGTLHLGETGGCGDSHSCPTVRKCQDGSEVIGDIHSHPGTIEDNIEVGIMPSSGDKICYIHSITDDIKCYAYWKSPYNNWYSDN